MKKQVWAFLLVLVFCSFSLSGCYYFSAKNQMKTAGSMISDLRSQGGEKLATYEYCSAEKFLEISNMEFNQNDYKQAKKFADRSRSAAEAGLAELQKNK